MTYLHFNIITRPTSHLICLLIKQQTQQQFHHCANRVDVQQCNHQCNHRLSPHCNHLSQPSCQPATHRSTQTSSILPSPALFRSGILIRFYWYFCSFLLNPFIWSFNFSGFLNLFLVSLAGPVHQVALVPIYVYLCCLFSS